VGKRVRILFLVDEFDGRIRRCFVLQSQRFFEYLLLILVEFDLHDPTAPIRKRIAVVPVSSQDSNYSQDPQADCGCFRSLQNSFYAQREIYIASLLTLLHI
jgi:hypothetical protein